jgi:ribonuclease HI
MAKKKFYAVKVGHKTGIFSSWQECSFAIKGFSGPCFNFFFSLEEALAFLNEPISDALPKKPAALKKAD